CRSSQGYSARTKRFQGLPPQISQTPEKPCVDVPPRPFYVARYLRLSSSTLTTHTHLLPVSPPPHQSLSTPPATFCARGELFLTLRAVPQGGQELPTQSYQILNVEP